MTDFRIRNAPLSIKLFVSLMLCVLALSYLPLLAGIWNDTELKITNVIQAYGGKLESKEDAENEEEDEFGFGDEDEYGYEEEEEPFLNVERIDESFKYMHWFLATFVMSISVMMMTSWPEKLKIVFAIVPPVFIVSDIGSMWVIRYSNFFAYQLYASGTVLATAFFVMFWLIQYDIWLKKK